MEERGAETKENTPCHHVLWLRLQITDTIGLAIVFLLVRSNQDVQLEGVPTVLVFFQWAARVALARNQGGCEKTHIASGNPAAQRANSLCLES